MKLKRQEDLNWGRFGAMLALTIAATPIWWMQSGAREFLLSGAAELCWPGFDSCAEWRFVSLRQIDFVLISMGAGAIFSSICLWLRPASRLSFWSLAVVFVAKLLLSALDYRLRGNHHQMANLVTLIFLILPRSAGVPIFALLIPSFYFAAGLLKLNTEWLSGAALANRLPLSGWLLEFGLIGVVLMELIGIWWLLDRRRSPWRFWVVIVVLVVFHLVSIKSVGFFYPVVMAALVSCFLWQHLDWPWPKNEAKEAFPRFFKSPFQFCRSIWVAMSWQFKLAWLISLIFLGIQFIPASISPRNDLSGEGRLIASSMVHNRTECRGFMVGRWGVHEAKIPMPVMQLPIRIWCDPLVFYNYARLVCRQKSPDRLDWYLLSRNSSEEAYQLIIRAEDFCRDSRRFPWFGSLPWRAE